MYIYLQRIFSFCETAESNNKIHAFDTTVQVYVPKKNMIPQNIYTDTNSSIDFEKLHQIKS